MLQQNRIQAGLILGLLLPFVVFSFLQLLFGGLEQIGFLGPSDFSPNFRVRTIALVAVGLNALLLNSFQKRYYTQAMRGVVIATGIYIIAWLAYFSSSIF